MQRITPEDQRTIRTVCPLFNRIAACYCNNPDYGVTLSPKAKRALNMGKKPIKTQAKSKVVSARVNEEKAELLNSCAAQRGITVAELISQTIDYIIDPYKELMEDEQDFETAVCQGLSREDRDV